MITVQGAMDTGNTVNPTRGYDSCTCIYKETGQAELLIITPFCSHSIRVLSTEYVQVKTCKVYCKL